MSVTGFSLCLGEPPKAEFEAPHPLAFTGTGFTMTARSFLNASAADGDVGARRKRLKIALWFSGEASARRGVIYRRANLPSWFPERWGNAG